jgi:hypothetical protein
MKLKDIEVGGCYLAKVSGKMITVRVTDVVQLGRTVIYAVNEASGRRILIRSPKWLRGRVVPGCEFCSREFNRSDERFECPYCHLVWEDGKPVRAAR